MLVLTLTFGGMEQDYTRYVVESSIQITEQINIPSQMKFSMIPIGSAFVVPPGRSYVRLYSTNYEKSLFTGFVTVAPVLTYLARSDRVPASAGGQLFQYDFVCTSDEYLLNIKAIPFIPAYVNQYQGDILANLAETLCPGFFDTSMCQQGDLVPYFEYQPSVSWCEVAKKFADASRYRYKVRDRMVWYVPYADGPFGIVYDETKGQGNFTPKDLKTTILTVPVVNDVTVVGAVEAGNNHEDYFLGDGFTANFPLLHVVFRGASSMLLQEAWSEGAGGLNTQNWFLQDPGDNFTLQGGGLNVIDTLPEAFGLGQSYLEMLNGIELAGGVDIQIGEVTFNDYSDGVLGGIYSDELMSATGLVAGFNVSSPNGVVFGASGTGPYATAPIGVSGVFIQPWYGASGGVVGFENGWILKPAGAMGPAVMTEINHDYVLQLVVHAPQYTRYQQTYRTLEGEEYGGTNNLSYGASLTWVVQDYDITAATGFFYTPKITQYTLGNLALPPFGAFALVNNRKLNITITNTTIALMPMGGLTALCGPYGLWWPTGLILPMMPADSGDFIGTTITPSGWLAEIAGDAVDIPFSATASLYPEPLPLVPPPTVQVLGNGFDLQAAQITSGNEADTLAFYAQSTPAAGTPVRFQSWEAQAAVSRLQDPASMAEEAFVVGDDGIRSAIVTNMSPLPRTSEDCDSAAQAFLQDRTGLFYNGSYTCTSYFFHGETADAQFWPTVGRFFGVNAPYRNIARQQMLVTQLTVSMLSMVDEIVQFQIGFGADLHLEKVLYNFVDILPPQVLTPTDKANPPNPRLIQNVNNSFLPDLDETSVDLSSITSTSATVNVLDAGYTGWPIEIRQIDSNWGLGKTPDLVDIVTGPQFSLRRSQYDQVWYLRGVQNGVVSRRSKVLRIMWPQRPLPPIVQSVTPVTESLMGIPGATGTVTVNSLAIQFQFNGDQRNIFGFELRAADNQTVLVQVPANFASMYVDLAQTPMPYLPPPLNTDYSLYAYFFNQRWEYSAPTAVEEYVAEEEREPWIWSPAYQKPYPNDAFSGPMGDMWYPDVFGVAVSYPSHADGTEPPTVTLKGLPIINVVSQTQNPPLLTSARAAVGGTVPPGTYEFAVSRVSGPTSTETWTDLSDSLSVTVASPNNAVQLTTEFMGPGDSGLVYYATPDHSRGWHLLVAGGIEVDETVGNTFTVVALPSWADFMPGAPDSTLANLIVEYRQVYMGGITTCMVLTAPTGAHTLTVSPPGILYPLVGPPSGGFVPGSLIGRVVSMYAKKNTLYDVPYLNLKITGNTANTLTFDSGTVDLTTLGHGGFEDGDTVVIRMMPVWSPSGFSDSLLQGPWAPSGLLASISGKMALIIEGTGAWQPPIQIATTTATAVSLSAGWQIQPDSSSVVVIVDQMVTQLPVGAYQLPNISLGQSNVVATVALPNWADAIWLLRVLTAKADGTYTDNPWVRYREVYVTGSIGSQAGAISYS